MRERKTKKCINFLYIWFHQDNGIESLSYHLARINHQQMRKGASTIFVKEERSLLLLVDGPPRPLYLLLIFIIFSRPHFIHQLIFMMMIFVWVSHMSSSIIWFAFFTFVKFPTIVVVVVVAIQELFLFTLRNCDEREREGETFLWFSIKKGQECSIGSTFKAVEAVRRKEITIERGLHNFIMFAVQKLSSCPSTPR